MLVAAESTWNDVPGPLNSKTLQILCDFQQSDFHAITVGVPIQILGVTIRMFGAGTTFLGEVAPEICSQLASFKYFYSRSSPTHPAWSIFKQSSGIPVSKSSLQKLRQFVLLYVALGNFTERAPHMPFGKNPPKSGQTDRQANKPSCVRCWGTRLGSPQRGQLLIIIGIFSCF